MAHPVVVVKATLDAEAGVWFVEWSDLPGLNAEAPSLDALMAKLPGAVRDLLEDDGGSDTALDIPIELIARASTWLRVPA